MRRRFGSFSFVSVAGAVIGATACTFDYDRFEPRGTDATGDGSAPAPPAADGGSPPVSSDASFDASPDVVTPIDSGPSCTDKAVCASTAKTCRDTCATDLTTCESKCGGGNPGQTCRNQCAVDRNACDAKCKSTCESCAGAACVSVCN
jgi:hypothetical protein